METRRCFNIDPYEILVKDMNDKRVKVFKAPLVPLISLVDLEPSQTDFGFRVKL